MTASWLEINLHPVYPPSLVAHTHVADNSVALCTPSTPSQMLHTITLNATFCAHLLTTPTPCPPRPQEGTLGSRLSMRHSPTFRVLGHLGRTFCTPPSSTPSSPQNATLSGRLSMRREAAICTCSIVSCTRCRPRRTCPPHTLTPSARALLRTYTRASNCHFGC